MQRIFANRTTAAATAATTAISTRMFSSVRTAVEDYSGSHEEFVKKISSGNTICDFYTEWCGPCKQIAPMYADLSEKHPDVTFLKVNVEENEDIGAMMNVRSIPYFVLFKDGKNAGSIEGSNLKKLTELIESAKK